MNSINKRLGNKSKLCLNARSKNQCCNNPSGLSKKLICKSDKNFEDVLKLQQNIETPLNKHQVFVIENISPEQEIERYPWIPIQEQLQIDDILQKNNDKERFSIEDKNNIKLEDSKPCLEKLKGKLSSAALHKDTICRLCATKLDMEECMLSDNGVFSNGYPEKILTCTSLKVIQGDGLPPKMCLECVTNLNRSYDFRNICMATSNFFKSLNFKNSFITNLTHDKLDLTEKKHAEFLTTDNGTVHNITQNEAKNNNGSGLCQGQKIGFIDESSFSYCDGEKEFTAMASPKTEPVNHISDEEEGATQTCKRCCGSGLELVVEKQSENECEKMEIEESIGDSSYLTSIQNENDTVTYVNEVFCDDITKEEFDKGEDPVIDWDESVAESDEMETKKPIFNLTYSLNLNKNIKIAKKDIAKYIKNGGSEVWCPFCPVIFDGEQYRETTQQYLDSIQQHLESHLPVKILYECRYEDCNEQLSLKRRITHEGTDHGMQQWEERKVLCHHCGDMVSPGVYKNHTLKRSKSQAAVYYECDLCSQQFKHKFILRTHIEGFHDLKRIECKICKKMILYNKWRYHNNVHEAKVTCRYCNKEFLRRNIKGHLRTHTGEKPFSCADCGLEFTFRVSLKTHRKRYHADDMFEGV